MRIKIKCKNCNKQCPLNYKEIQGEKVYHHRNSMNTGKRTCMTIDIDGKLKTHKEIYCGCDSPQPKTK